MLKPVRYERMARTVERLIAFSRGDRSEPASEFRMDCLGSFRIEAKSEQQGPIKWRTSKTRELFAYFVTYRGEPVHKDRILEDVWTDFNIDNAVSNLHTSIYHIRRMIKQYQLHRWLELHYTNSSYQLVAEGVACDAEQFMQSAEDCLAMPSIGIEPYERAAALYTDDYMKEDDFSWAEPRRQLMQTAYMEIAGRLAEHYVAEGLYANAIWHLNKMVNINPFSEDVHELLLRTYALKGERTAFIRQFNLMQKLMREELGIDLRPSTIELYRQLGMNFN